MEQPAGWRTRCRTSERIGWLVGVHVGVQVVGTKWCGYAGEEKDKKNRRSGAEHLRNSNGRWT